MRLAAGPYEVSRPDPAECGRIRSGGLLYCAAVRAAGRPDRPPLDIWPAPFLELPWQPAGDMSTSRPLLKTQAEHLAARAANRCARALDVPRRPTLTRSVSRNDHAGFDQRRLRA